MNTVIKFRSLGLQLVMLAWSAPTLAGGLVPYVLKQIDAFGIGGGLGSTVALAPPYLVVGSPEAVVLEGGIEIQRAGQVVIARWHDAESRWHLLHRVSLAELGQPVQVLSRFGAAVAASGQRVLIGCPGCAPGTAPAWLLELEDDGDSFQAYPVDPQPRLPDVADPEQGLASALALLNDIVAIGSPRALLDTVEAGEVLIGRFDADGVEWVQRYQGWPASRYGHSLALAIDSGIQRYWLAVGAPEYRAAESEPPVGRVGMHVSSSTGWSDIHVIEPADSEPYGRFGAAVAIHHTPTIAIEANKGYLVVGSPNRVHNDVVSGSAYVYYFTGTVPVLHLFEQELIPPEPEDGDAFGASLAVFDTRLLVGAPGRRIDGVEAGAVSVFDRGAHWPAPSDWPWQQDLTPSLRSGGLVGASVALSARAAIVGAPRYPTQPQAGDVATYLCEQLFTDDFEGTVGANACTAP